MRSDLPNRFQLLIKSASLGFALIAAVCFAAPCTRAQQNLDQTDKQDAKKQPAPKKPVTKKQKGFFESIRGDLEFGGRLVELDGDKPGKFQETRQVPKGPYIRNIELNFEKAESPYFFRFRGQEIGERDESFVAEAGRIGR